MVTQGERQNYVWRPNDNSTTTKVRYNLEAKHWLDAVKSNTAKTNYSTDYFVGFGFLGTVFSMFMVMLMLLMDTVIRLIKFIITSSTKKVDNYSTYDSYEAEERRKFEEYARRKREEDRS